MADGFAYNGANEFTTMTEGGVTTTYTYDDWGRTISKADGTHSATYGWRFGDKLRTYASTFPGEADVNFQYDGLGKRRMKLTNPSAPTDADRTWYRWDAGWNMIGEYAAGTDTGTTWDVGALTRWYQGKAAHADGDPDSTAYNYYAHDHLGSPRTTYSQGQAVLARIEFTPYGSPMTTTGQDMDLGYTGHKWDAETGSFYAPYRYYSPATVRWASRDPLGMVDGPNFYIYVGGLPTRRIDQIGLFGGPIVPPGVDPTGPGGPYYNPPPRFQTPLTSPSKMLCAFKIGNGAVQGVITEGRGGTDYEHCYYACKIEKECGKGAGRFAAWAVEAWQSLDQNDWSESEITAGNRGADAGGNCEDCSSACDKAYPNQKL